MEQVCRGECLCKRFKKTLPILVLTFIEYSGLNQIILRLRLHLSLACGSDVVSGDKNGLFLKSTSFQSVTMYILILYILNCLVGQFHRKHNANLALKPVCLRVPYLDRCYFWFTLMTYVTTYQQLLSSLQMTRPFSS